MKAARDTAANSEVPFLKKKVYSNSFIIKHWVKHAVDKLATLSAAPPHPDAHTLPPHAQNIGLYRCFSVIFFHTAMKLRVDVRARLAKPHVRLVETHVLVYALFVCDLHGPRFEGFFVCVCVCFATRVGTEFRFWGIFLGNPFGKAPGNVTHTRRPHRDARFGKCVGHACPSVDHLY